MKINVYLLRAKTHLIFVRRRWRRAAAEFERATDRAEQLRAHSIGNQFLARALASKSRLAKGASRQSRLGVW